MSIRLLSAMLALLAGTMWAAASNDLKLRGYKPQVVVGSTTALEVQGKDGPLTAVEITPPDGLTVSGIHAKTPEPGQSLPKRAKLWEFQIAVAPGTPLGERSVRLKTEKADSVPGTLVLVPYVPVVQSMRIVSTKGEGAAVEIEMAVQDKESKLGANPGLTWFMHCNPYMILSSSPGKVVEQKDATTSIVRGSFSQMGARAKGTCELAISIRNEAGYTSSEQRTTVTFE